MKFKNSLPDDKSKVLSIDELFFTHFNELCFYSYTYIPNMEVAKDIVQEAFLSLWVNRESYIPTRTLLYTLVKNKAIDYLREKKKYRCITDTQSHGDIFHNYVNDLIINQEDYLAVNDLSKEIEKSINKLPSQCRKIFEMSRFRHMKNKEIAKKLNISVKAVEKQITKALSFIHTHLRKAGLYCLLLIFCIFL